MIACYLTEVKLARIGVMTTLGEGGLIVLLAGTVIKWRHFELLI